MAGSLDQYKRGFFDRPAVQGAMDAATQKVLSRFGSYVRRRAQTSMKRPRGKKAARKASAPGSPPNAHSRDAFASLKNILFAYDAAKKTVVIGPPLLNGRGHRIGRETTPELQEYGGTAEKREAQLSGGRWVPAGVAAKFRDGKTRPTRVRPATYPSRPFMRPAFQAELAGKLRDQLRDCVRPV